MVWLSWSKTGDKWRNGTDVRRYATSRGQASYSHHNIPPISSLQNVQANKCIFYNEHVWKAHQKQGLSNAGTLKNRKPWQNKEDEKKKKVLSSLFFLLHPCSWALALVTIMDNVIRRPKWSVCKWRKAPGEKWENVEERRACNTKPWARKDLEPLM